MYTCQLCHKEKIKDDNTAIRCNDCIMERDSQWKKFEADEQAKRQADREADKFKKLTKMFGWKR